MSWKIEVQADSTGTWAGNALRFATQLEAKTYALDLASRWINVRQYRVTESEDPVSHKLVGRGVRQVGEGV